MAARKKRGTTPGTGRACTKRYPATPAAETARVPETAVMVRRKNFDLDQHRLDQLRIALGAKTERDAIASAMDIALDVLALEREMRAGADAMFGRGGFKYMFDEPDALDFSGFHIGRERARRR